MVGMQRISQPGDANERLTVDANISPLAEQKYGQIMSLLGPNLKTLNHLLHANRRDFAGPVTLEAEGLPVHDVAEYTGFPEMLEGRVKTLHPTIHGGILADRSKPEHLEAIAEYGIRPIDLVCVNLYPFAAVVAKPDVALEDAIENIDIGGPAMIRSAAKNHTGVIVVVHPTDYTDLLAEQLVEVGPRQACLPRDCV
jgi:hypothetical protein